jgi:hypothetical protein
MEATTKVVAPISWIEAGRIQQFSETVLAAVHNHNRHADNEQFIALDFPNAVFRREFAGVAGPVARLIGSEQALDVILKSERLQQFQRPGLQNSSNLISSHKSLQDGYCLVRSQRSGKIQPGAIRRQIRRAIRNGFTTEHLEAKLATADSMSKEDLRKSSKVPAESSIFLGKIPFFFKKIKASNDTGVALVSTYGMSDPNTPVIFDRWITDTDAKRHRNFTSEENVFASLFEEESA